MTFEPNRTAGLAGSIARGRGSIPLQAGERVRSVGPFALARSLLGGAGVIAMGVVLTSVAGVSPLAGKGPAGACLAAGVATGVGLLWRAQEPLAEAPASPPWLLRSGRLALGAGALATVIAMALALWLPIGAYDAIGYRVPAVAQWLDAGGWSWVSGDDPLRNGYPLGLELVEAALFAGFDSAAAIDAVSSAFVVAGALSLLGLARTLGLMRGAGELAAGLFLLVPMHLLNAPSGYADAAFAGAMVCLMVAVARCLRGEDAWLELGLAAAWTVAIKPHGIAFAGLALLVMLARRRELGLARAVAVGSLGGVFALRNVLRTGNPLYPVELRIGGTVLLPGEQSLDNILTPAFNVPAELAALPAWLRPLWVWLQPHGPARSFDDRLAGFGYAFALVALPALGLVLLRLRNDAARTLLLVAGLSLVCWLLQPFSFWPRFTSWLWGAGSLAVAVLVSELCTRGKQRLALAVVTLALVLALPEAGYALAHVKRLDAIEGVWSMSEHERLARMAKLEPAFLTRALLGRSDVCRTPWRLGTDDANLDGVVAQLSPRPRMHVVAGPTLARALAEASALGCDALIVIGDDPMAEQAQPSSVERVRAFGMVSLVSVSQNARATARSLRDEVTP